MPQTPRKNISLSVPNKSHYCSKVNCQRLLTLKHPTSYTNGLCERHFFLIDLPSNPDDDNDLPNASKDEQIQSIKNPYEPIRGDTRMTREIFDGRQWRIFEEALHHEASTNNIDNSYLTMPKDNNDTLLQVFRLLSSYKTVLDELKLKNPN